MVERSLKYMTGTEYLKQEWAAIQNPGYYKGGTLALHGVTLKHNTIQMNFYGEVSAFLKGKTCKVYGSGLRIYIPSSSLFSCPDAFIVCSKPQLLEGEMDILLNPVIIVEILCKSTQSYDRGDKFMLYRAISSFKEYILIGSEAEAIEHFSKQENGNWMLEEIKSILDVLQLHNIKFSLPLSFLFEGVEV